MAIHIAGPDGKPSRRLMAMASEVMPLQQQQLTWGWTREEIDLIKETVAKNSTDNELKLFLIVARKTGLDPFSKQIYCVKRYSRKEGKYTMVIQTGVDGFRLIAERTGQYAGQLGPFWCGPDGQWTDVWLSKNPPSAAKVGILRKDFKEAMWATANWDAYVQLDDGKPGYFWQKMGPGQLAKCAECLGFRKAFPQETSGLLGTEEMQQADSINIKAATA